MFLKFFGFFGGGFFSFFLCFFGKKNAVSGLKTQNCRGKLTFKVAETHLALRSPMFGELCIWFFCVIFNGIDVFAVGFMFKVDYKKW